LAEAAGVEHAEGACLCMCGKRAPQRGPARLAVDLRAEVAVVRREGHAPAGPVRSTRGAGASAPGSLLAPRLGAAARDQATALAAARPRAGARGADRCPPRGALRLPRGADAPPPAPQR